MRFTIGVLLSITVQHALAQSPAPKTAPRQTPVQSAFLTKPLPLSIDTVGPNFRGHDIVAIFGELKRSPSAATKSEFETTQQYEKRIQSLLSSKDRQYVFVLDEFTAAATYDADKGTMNVSATAAFVSGLFDSDIHMVNETNGDSTYLSSGIELRSIHRSTTQYVASNGFGVKVTVTRSTFDEFGIVLSKDDALFADAEDIGSRKADVVVDMDVPTAKALKPFLHVALICTLVNPTAYEGTSGTSPTVSSPREIKTTQHYLLVRPDELWVYDRRSGRILGKLAPGDDPKAKIR